MVLPRQIDDGQNTVVYSVVESAQRKNELGGFGGHCVDQRAVKTDGAKCELVEIRREPDLPTGFVGDPIEKRAESASLQLEG